MREGETLKAYSNRYWEMYNKINGDFEDVAISTFKVGLLNKHGLRKSLTGKPITSVCQLMDRIDKYKRVKKDQNQEKGKTKVIPQKRRDFRSDRFNTVRPQKDYVGPTGSTNAHVINVVFQEPVHQVLKRIKINHSLNVRTRWTETLRDETEASIVNIIKTKDIP